MTALTTSEPATARPAAHSSTLRRVGAEAAAFSAGIHLWVAPEHVREWWVYGAFFIGVAAAQALLAWLLLHRATVLVLLAGIWGNIVLVGVYVASRTVGLPLTPPHAGHVTHQHLPVAGGIGNGIPIYPGATTSGSVEAVGTLDLFALSAELVLVVVLVGMLPAGLRRVMTNVMLALGVAVWAVRALVALT
jgi:hypothetical protein